MYYVGNNEFNCKWDSSGSFIAIILVSTWIFQLSTVLSSPLDPVPQLVKDGSYFSLNEFIRYHEPANYNRQLLMRHRVKRNIQDGQDSPLNFDIKAHHRIFRLRLKADQTLFDPNVEFRSTLGKIVNFDPGAVYTGTLEDDESAIVNGLITQDGLFDGTITTKLDDYFIEPLNRYAPINTLENDIKDELLNKLKLNNVHSIMYKASDVIYPYNISWATNLETSVDQKSNSRWKRWLPHEEDDSYHISSSIYHHNQHHQVVELKRKSPNDTPSYIIVGQNHHIYNRKPMSTSSIISKMFNRTKVKIITNTPPQISPSPPSLPPRRYPGALDNEIHTLFEFPEAELDLLTPSNNNSSGDLFLSRHSAQKRATAIDPKKTTCMLYLQADHQFYQKYGTEEACIEVMTRHVQRVNTIYRITDFNQDGKPDNISFMIKRIKVHTMDALKDPFYRFPNNYGVEKFLELFSEEDYDAFCLAYMFTYRDFEMGTLGLAWTGDLKNAGGVCEKNGHYRGSMKSLNTGIVTLLNYGKHVPPAVSHVTLAHEIGHNFGSPHDPELCTPGGEDGNFIMFARATSGDKKNNNQFSPCSLKSINPVLNFKARSTKGCFTEPQTSLCGNGVVEDGEECDCGWEEDCRDQCCYPQRRHPPTDEPPCKLTPSSICSPSQGPCCTSECQLKFGEKCRDDNGCRDESFCDGRGPQCPPSVNKPNKTICNDGFVCFMGECTGSICLAYGLESCQCIPTANEPKTKACELCCKLPGDQQPCLSSFDWNEMPYDIPDMYAKPGTPCNDYNGYCDVFQKCREVDPSGPLATLRKLLLSEESIASYKKYLVDYWYAALLIAAMFFSLLILIVKMFGKQPNSKLKTVTIMHSSTTETVRLPPTSDNSPNTPGTEISPTAAQITVHPALRSKLPLKQKVRNGKKRRTRHQKAKDLASSSANSSPTKKSKTSKKPLKSNKRGLKDTSRKSKITPIKNTKNKKKETIDYSAEQKDNCTLPIVTTPVGDTSTIVDDPVGKVQNWLLKSQLPIVIPKSKSTPAGLLTERRRSSPPTHKPPVTGVRPPTGDKCKSVGHLPDSKVRLQVIYKPPFKFSVKLRKADTKSNSVVVVDRNCGQRVADRSNRTTATHTAGGGTTNVQPPQAVRTGLLVRSNNNNNKERKSYHRRHRSVTNQLPPSNNSNIGTGIIAAGIRNDDFDIDSNIHTVQSDLEVLLSESEFLFSDA